MLWLLKSIINGDIVGHDLDKCNPVAWGVKVMPSRRPVGLTLSLEHWNKVPFSANVVPETAVAPCQHDASQTSAGSHSLPSLPLWQTYYQCRPAQVWNHCLDQRAHLFILEYSGVKVGFKRCFVFGVTGDLAESSSSGFGCNLQGWPPPIIWFPSNTVLRILFSHNSLHVLFNSVRGCFAE